MPLDGPFMVREGLRRSTRIIATSSFRCRRPSPRCVEQRKRARNQSRSVRTDKQPGSSTRRANDGYITRHMQGEPVRPMRIISVYSLKLMVGRLHLEDRSQPRSSLSRTSTSTRRSLRRRPTTFTKQTATADHQLEGQLDLPTAKQSPPLVRSPTGEMFCPDGGSTAAIRARSHPVVASAGGAPPGPTEASILGGRSVAPEPG